MTTKLYLLGISLLTLPFAVQGQNYNGEDGGDYGTGSNWNNGVVPSAADNINVFGPGGPVVSSTGHAGTNLFLRGSSPASRLTVASGGEIIIGSYRIGFNSAGTAELIVSGGNLTATNDIYVGQSIGTGGSRLRITDGSINVTTHIRVGFSDIAHFEMLGGTVTGANIFVAQGAGSGGSLMEIEGGTLNISNGLVIGFEDEGTLRIRGNGASINLGNLNFGRNGNAVLEMQLSSEGTVSPIITGSLNLGNPVSRTLRVIGSAVANTDALSGVELFRATGQNAETGQANTFTNDQIAILNESLELVGLPEGYSLALAEEGTTIVLTKGGEITPTYAGYTIEPVDHINTENLAGWLYIGAQPWLFSYRLGTWLYGPESSFSAAGAWLFALRPQGEADDGIRASGDASAWAGYLVREEKFIDSGAFMGTILITHEPWLFSYRLNSWIYGMESTFNSTGAWAFYPQLVSQ